MSKNHIAKTCQSQDYSGFIDFPNLTVGQNLAKVVPNSIFCSVLMLNKNDHLENSVQYANLICTSKYKSFIKITAILIYVCSILNSWVITELCFLCLFGFGCCFCFNFWNIA